MNINKDLYIENSDVTVEEIAEFIKNRRFNSQWCCYTMWTYSKKFI